MVVYFTDQLFIKGTSVCGGDSRDTSSVSCWSIFMFFQHCGSECLIPNWIFICVRLSIIKCTRKLRVSGSLILKMMVLRQNILFIYIFILLKLGCCIVTFFIHKKLYALLPYLIFQHKIMLRKFGIVHNDVQPVPVTYFMSYSWKLSE